MRKKAGELPSEYQSVEPVLMGNAGRAAMNIERWSFTGFESTVKWKRRHCYAEVFRFWFVSHLIFHLELQNEIKNQTKMSQITKKVTNNRKY